NHIAKLKPVNERSKVRFGKMPKPGRRGDRSNASTERGGYRIYAGTSRTNAPSLIFHPLMAFRIHDSVVRGEIDNRTKGIISGKIWVEGRDQPVILNLKGNAHPDLAGCLLTFTNCGKRFAYPHLDSLTREQLGMAGDMT